jgi:flagellar assembly protein FliH
MGTIVVKFPSRFRNKIRIIRSQEMIDKERSERQIRVKKYLNIEDEVIVEKKEIHEELFEEEEIVEEIIEQGPKIIPPPEFTQTFVFSNSNQPIEINLNNIPEPSLPLSIVKEEIQKAYDTGISDGMIQSKATFKSEIEKYHSWIRRIDDIAEEIAKQNYSAIQNMEKAVVDLSIMVAKHILQREVLHDSNIVLEQVNKAINSIDEDNVFKIQVHPDYVDILEKSRSKLLADSSKAQKIIIAADSSVKPGDCILETAAGTVDARIETQLNMIKLTLDDAHQKYEQEKLMEVETQITEIRNKMIDEQVKNEVYTPKIEIDENDDEYTQIEKLANLQSERAEEERKIMEQMKEEWGNEFFDDDESELNSKLDSF